MSVAWLCAVLLVQSPHSLAVVVVGVVCSLSSSTGGRCHLDKITNFFFAPRCNRPIKSAVFFAARFRDSSKYAKIRSSQTERWARLAKFASTLLRPSSTHVAYAAGFPCHWLLSHMCMVWCSLGLTLNSALSHRRYIRFHMSNMVCAVAGGTTN